MKSRQIWPYTISEEIINASTHGVGCVASLVICIIFLVKSTSASFPLSALCFSLYLFGVVSSYAASTVYHTIPSSHKRAKSIARKFDHAAIFWHIAGSYTPITLIGMKNGGEPVWAWVIFSLVWVSAAVGTALSFRKMKNQSYLETACYVLMGLTIVIAFKPFYDSCGLGILLWVVGEGIAYITGAVLYSFKKVPYMHSVFHVFVILGELCHMIATWMLIKLFIL
jgi:hemolysin III